MRTVRSSRADVIVSIVLVLLLGTFTIGQVQMADEIANRVKCASNLRQIGQAILLYSNENRGASRARGGTSTIAEPTWGTPYEGNAKLGPVDAKKSSMFIEKDADALPKANDVTAALFLLLRTQDITPDVFVCPSTGQNAMSLRRRRRTRALNWTNWPGNKGIARSPELQLSEPVPDEAGDRRGLEAEQRDQRRVRGRGGHEPRRGRADEGRRSPPASTPCASATRPNHGGDGQNVLYGDGHVEFTNTRTSASPATTSTPTARAARTTRTPPATASSARRVGPNDSFLLPTAKDVGIVDANGKLTEAARKRRDAPHARHEARHAAAAGRRRGSSCIGTYVQEQDGTPREASDDEGPAHRQHAGR